MKTYLRLFFCLAVLAGCGGGDDDNEEVLPPSNLVVQIDVEDGNTGKVNVKATAENARFYRISFGYYSVNVPVQSMNGQASFVYPFSGTYNIKVTAYSTEAVFIEKTEATAVTKVYDGPSSPESYDGMSLIWSDEFDGTSLNTDDWTFEIGNGASGWGNNELEYYRSDNTSLTNGNLVIKATNEGAGGFAYTSSRIITKDKQTFQYGRIDIRAVLPQGQGIWPALWTLGNNISDPNVGWPKCGEIDIMEMVGGGGKEKTVHGTLHWFDTNGYASSTSQKNISEGTYSDKYHVYSLAWTPDELIWYIDNVEFKRIDTTPDVAPERFDEFRAPHFLIFNVAVGGNWPGSPDATTRFPQRMIVDYVRYFQEN